MYELGLAHAAKKNVIMLIQQDEDVPFDISYIRYLKYDYRVNLPQNSGHTE